MRGRFIEVCCESVQDAVQAFSGGADRVELCAELSVGGVTPDMEDVTRVRRMFPDKMINVLVRCRAGDFVYSREEVDLMASQIRACRDAGADGVVIGALTRSGSIDMEAMHTLVGEARRDENRCLSVTFHRAFDESVDMLPALEDVISLGCERLLTSGCCRDAFEGRFNIAALVRQSAGRIVIMAGCGVRPSNVVEIEKITLAPEYHSSSHGTDEHTSAEVVKLLKTI